VKIAGLPPRCPVDRMVGPLRGRSSGERAEEQRPAATFGFIGSNWPESRVRRARVRVRSSVLHPPSASPSLHPPALPLLSPSLSLSLFLRWSLSPFSVKYTKAFRDGLFAQGGVRVSRSPERIEQGRRADAEKSDCVRDERRSAGMDRVAEFANRVVSLLNPEISFHRSSG